MIFALDWFIVPITKEYLNVAEFSVGGKIKRALKALVPILIFYVVSFIIVVIYLSFTPNGRQLLQTNGLVGTLIGLALDFGYISIILLLGYGIAKFPLITFKLADN